MEISHLVSDYSYEHALNLRKECSNDVLVDDKGVDLCMTNLIINRIEDNLNNHVDLVQ